MDAYADENNCPDLSGPSPEPKSNVPSDQNPDEGHRSFEECKEQGWSERMQTSEAERNSDTERVEAERNDKCCDPERH